MLIPSREARILIPAARGPVSRVRKSSESRTIRQGCPGILILSRWPVSARRASWPELVALVVCRFRRPAGPLNYAGPGPGPGPGPVRRSAPVLVPVKVRNSPGTIPAYVPEPSRSYTGNAPLRAVSIPERFRDWTGTGSGTVPYLVPVHAGTSSGTVPGCERNRSGPRSGTVRRGGEAPRDEPGLGWGVAQRFLYRVGPGPDRNGSGLCSGTGPGYGGAETEARRLAQGREEGCGRRGDAGGVAVVTPGGDRTGFRALGGMVRTRNRDSSGMGRACGARDSGVDCRAWSASHALIAIACSCASLRNVGAAGASVPSDARRPTARICGASSCGWNGK